MTVQTPYDDDRRQYTRTALARLVLADRARELSDQAGNLTVTRYDLYCGAGGRVSEASTLTALADRLLTSAVVYERERGSSWEDIGPFLGVSGAAAETRFAPAIDEWRTAFDVPYRLDETGRKRIPQLPTAAYDPRRVSRNLDLWARVHLVLDDNHAVSGGLDSSEGQDGTAPIWGDIDGQIQRQHLGTFLGLLSHYVGHYPAGSGWESALVALEDNDAANPEAWHSYAMAGNLESLDVRVARIGESELISIVVANAHSADLRLRISTLMDSFGRP